MYRLILYFITCLVLSTPVVAQTHLGVINRQHSFEISLTQMNGINKTRWADLNHWGDRFVIPEVFTAKNTSGFQTGISYEYTNKNHYTFASGLLFGIQQLDYKWKFPMALFDSVTDFSSVDFSHSYKERKQYVGLSISAGHNYYPFKNKRVKINAHVGLNYIRYFRANYENLDHIVFYQKALNDTIFVSPYANTQVVNDKWGMYYDIYLGVGYLTGHKIFKECRLGVDFTHAFGFFRRNSDFIGSAHGMYYDSKGRRMGGDTYYNRFRYVAFTLGLCL